MSAAMDKGAPSWFRLRIRARSVGGPSARRSNGVETGERSGLVQAFACRAILVDDQVSQLFDRGIPSPLVERDLTVRPAMNLRLTIPPTVI